MSRHGAPLILLIVGLVCGPTQARAHNHEQGSACRVLLERTQAFSDAGQSSDGRAMRNMLDDRVVFFNEGGDESSARDMSRLRPASGVPKAQTKMNVTDWGCELHGSVAVTSFIDEQDQQVAGERFHARYRSVETWLRYAGTWKLIGSSTIALNDDPPTITLPTAVLDEYAGTYEGASGQRFTFYRQGSDLVAETNGGTPTIQKAEVQDVFFTPGRARFRKVFERDAAGRVVAFAVRREGHDTVFRRVSS